MTLRRKAAVVSALLILAGAVAYESREVTRLRDQIESLRSPAGSLAMAERESQRATKPSQAGREAKQREEERLQRQRAAAFESIRSQQAADEADPPLNSVIGIDGQLSAEAVQRLNLTGDELASIKTTVLRVGAESTDDFMKRLKRTTSDDSRGDIYYARARPDRGRSFIDSLSREFESTLGKERAGRLMVGLAETYFVGAMGKFDMEIVVTRNDDGATRVKYRYRSPKTGAVSSSGESSLRVFEERFGNVFDDPADE